MTDHCFSIMIHMYKYKYLHTDMSGYFGYILRILLILRVVYILLILRVPYILYLCNLCPIMSFAYDCRIILDDWIFVIFIICLSFDSLSLVSRICRWGFLKMIMAL